jgi:hypothetical protein
VEHWGAVGERGEFVNHGFADALNGDLQAMHVALYPTHTDDVRFAD